MFYHKYILRFYVKSLSRYVEKYWGVTPWRVDYLQQVYGLKPHKIGLLTMGADDDLLNSIDKLVVRKEIRAKLGIADDSFVILTGGKIDKSKRIIELMGALSRIRNMPLSLVIFGSPSEEVYEEFCHYVDSNCNFYSIGWLDNKNIINNMLASDLIVFPGTHSVLWEQAVACGIPCVFSMWEGMTHVNIGGNCIFLKSSTIHDIHNAIYEILINVELYNYMKEAAMSDRRKDFYYSHIARKSIGAS